MHRSVAAVTAFTPTGTAANEQVIATLPCPPLGDNPLVSSIVIDAVISVTGGTSASNQTIRVRRGSLTGTQVGAPMAGGGANLVNFPINVVDAPVPNPPPLNYVITLQQTAATTNATVTYAGASATAS